MKTSSQLFSTFNHQEYCTEDIISLLLLYIDEMESIFNQALEAIPNSKDRNELKMQAAMIKLRIMEKRKQN